VVVSDNDDAPALDLARDAGVPAVAVSWAKHRALGGSRDGFDARVADVVARHNPDLVILAGYMRIVGAPMLEAFDDRLLNLHPALPGAFAGTDAIARAHQAFAEGKIQRTGVMVHRVTAVVDGGDPIAIEAVAMVDGESVDALAVRMHEAEHRVIVRAVARALPAAMADCDHRDALEHRSPR
jgi:formyltetrahydrofolate-dependent phosphoribosylglycinamide formyltransferase